MKICIVGKYPPIAGGVSAETYWFVRALAERGHHISIVTNSLLVEDVHKQQVDLARPREKKAYRAKNISIYSIAEKQMLSHNGPFPIPYLDAIETRLANLAIQVIEKNKCEIIESIYTLPYGFSGYLAKSFTGCKQILKTAGSDIMSLFKKDKFKYVFSRLFSNVDGLVSSSLIKKELFELGVSRDKFFPSPMRQINPNYFNHKAKPIDLKDLGVKKLNKNIPLLVVSGKASQYKGIFELVKALDKIKKRFFVLFIMGGWKLQEFVSYLKKHSNVMKKSKIIPFQPPWRMPGIIKRATCVISLERKFPIKGHMPILPREAFAMKKCTLISDEIFTRSGVKDKLIDGYNTFVVDPLDINELRKKLVTIITKNDLLKTIGENAYDLARERFTRFDDYINKRLAIYHKVLSSTANNDHEDILLPRILRT